MVYMFIIIRFLNSKIFCFKILHRDLDMLAVIQYLYWFCIIAELIVFCFFFFKYLWNLTIYHNLNQFMDYKYLNCMILNEIEQLKYVKIAVFHKIPNIDVWLTNVNWWFRDSLSIQQAHVRTIVMIISDAKPPKWISI